MAVTLHFYVLSGPLHTIPAPSHCCQPLHTQRCLMPDRDCIRAAPKAFVKAQVGALLGRACLHHRAFRQSSSPSTGSPGTQVHGNVPQAHGNAPSRIHNAAHAAHSLAKALAFKVDGKLQRFHFVVTAPEHCSPCLNLIDPIARCVGAVPWPRPWVPR